MRKPLLLLQIITLLAFHGLLFLSCHKSQDPPGIYACGHTAMEDFRGRELGVKAAEAFIYMTGKGMGWGMESAI